MAFGHSNAPGATYPELLEVRALANGGAEMEYSNSKTYAVGDYCNHDGKLYRCTTATAAEEWNADHWEATTIPQAVAQAEATAKAAQAAAAGGSDTAYSTAKTYAEGDYCNNDGKMYRCITAITTPEPWNPAHWQETNIGAELAAIRREAEAGGSGGGNVIKVTFGPEFVGKTYIVTDGAGETKNGTVPDNRVVNVSVTGCNTTYTIKATADGVEYQTELTTGPYYGQYSTVLNVFTATINVTAIPGAVVTATGGGLSYSATANSSGVAAVTVKKSGSYNVTATKGSKTSDSASVNATTDGGTYAATVMFTIENVPSQAGTLTFTGGEQHPEWNNCDDEEVTMGGILKGTNADDYPATATPKPGHKWKDGTTTAKTVNWSIGKAAGSLTLDKTSLSLNGSSPNGAIIATRAGDGAITATSSNPAVATADVDGNTVNVHGLSDGSTTITINVAEGTNHLAPQAKTCAVTAVDMVHIYGAQWDGSSTTKWTRTDEAAGFTDPVPYKAGMSAAQCSSPFDGKMPWAGMVRSTDSAAGELVAIPKFWYKLTANGNGLKIQIADKAQAGYSVSPAHMNRGDGKGERDTVYVGRYHCHTSNFKSQTGGNPKNNVTRANFRTSIHNLGSNIWQADFAMRFTLWLLYIVEFADWNSQATIGKGCGNNSGVQSMGYTDSMPYHTGTTQSSRDTYGLGTQYRNIEGLWDNVYDWCDGCYYNSSGLNIILNPANFSDTTGGTLVGKPSSGYPSKFTVSSAGGFPVFYPTEANGGETTYSCDYWYFSASGPCLCVGGYYGQSGSRGLFYVYYTDATGASVSHGSRLQKLP